MALDQGYFLAHVFKIMIFFRLILIADKYNLTGLLSHCEESLAKMLNLDNVIDITKITFMINQVVSLRSRCIEYIADNLEPLTKTPGWERDIASNCKILEAIVKKN